MKVYQDAYDGALKIRNDAKEDVSATSLANAASKKLWEAAVTAQTAAVANCKGV